MLRPTTNAALLGAILALAAPPAARPAERFDVGRLLVEVPAPAGAEAPEILPADLEVLENGTARTIRGLEPIGGEWRIVVYFDQLLTPPPVFRSALLDLSEASRQLTALGAVEIVLAGEDLKTALPPTRDPLTVAEAFSWLRIRESSEGAQLALRRGFLEELLAGRDPEAAPTPEEVAAAGAAVRQAVADEAEALRAARRRLLTWLADGEADGPRVVLLVSGGFDAEPSRFYRTVLGGTPWADAAAGLGGAAETWGADVAQALSIYGWIVLPFAPAARGDALLAEREGEGEPRQEGEDEVETVFQDGRVVDRVLVRPSFDPRKALKKLMEKRRGGEPGPEAELLAPLAPLTVLAEASGGELIGDRPQLEDALSRLSRRLRLVYQSAPDPRGAPTEVRVRRAAPAGHGGGLRARRWTASATPEAIAALRAERYLDGEDEEGEVAVAAVLRERAGEGGSEVVVEVDPAAVGGAAGPASSWRVTLAIGGDEDELRVEHRLVPRPVPDSETGIPRLALPVEPPQGADAMLLVFVEELSTGRWGGTVAAAAGVAGLGRGDDSYFLLPAPKVIHLMAPPEAMVMGPTRFETVVSQERVSRVDFFLDGRRVASGASPPFSATMDLGKLPETHRVEAVAFGAGGEELGRDRLTVNAGLGAFRVRIVSPRRADLPPERNVTGPVDVQAEVEVPRGGRLGRLEFFWKDRLVATRYAPPFAQRIRVPEDDPKGFIRVLGHLENGETSEDVLFLNSPGSAERLNVDLVQLYVVVTDRRGRPIKGLGQGQFRVLEEGEPQELANFGDAVDQPLTLGLAIDSSASMFVKLPDVQEAAAEFIRNLSGAKDRAFVVGFGNEPRLARDTTADLSQVVRGLYRLEPDGRTAIWKAVVYSLIQLQGAGGKKALIVYSDGADEDPDFSYRTTLEFARRVGAPIYFIVSNDEIYRTGGKSLTVRGFLGRLERLASEVGGRVFFTRVGEDLGQIYREIEEELRSQYLLGYYARDLGGDRWRRIKVEVAAPGATARTLAGYFR